MRKNNEDLVQVITAALDEAKMGECLVSASNLCAIREALSHRPEGVPGWQPIETAPRDGRFALVYRPLACRSTDHAVAIKKLVDTNNFCWPETVPDGQEPCNPTNGACHVTHWMPIPDAPAALSSRKADKGASENVE